MNAQAVLGSGAPDATGAAFVALLSDPTTTARLLDAVAAHTGDPRFRGAAGLLRGRPGGRPARADDGALSQMAALLRDGAAKTPEQAARFVARALSGEVSTDGAAARLARKYRQQN